MPSTRAHPHPEELRAFALGLLPAAALDAVANHVADCAACCEFLAGVQADDLVELARQVRLDARGETPGSSAGTLVGDDLIPAELRNHPRYRILQVIGSGGMGTVYLAEHRFMERRVALKVIHPRFTAHPTAVARFSQEVRTAASLHHPNIVAAHDAEQAGDLHFLVMEFVPGRSLDRILREGPLSIPRACDFVRQAAAGLAHAHAQGMVHRDIKPHNLMVTPDGRLKILDFGLARMVREAHAGEEDTQQLTGANTVLGTPDYLAPEQASDARKADARADLYSLGCTFYHLLAGHPPFPEGTVMERLFQHREKDARPIREVRPEVPAEVAALVHRLLAKRPEDRVASAAAVVERLTPFLEISLTRDEGDRKVPQAPAQSHPPGRISEGGHRRRRRWAAIAVGLVLIVSTAVALWLASGAAPNRRVLFVLPPRNLWYEDFDPVRKKLLQEGYEVVTASTRPGPIPLVPESKGEPVRAGLALDDSVRAGDYRALVFCGADSTGLVGEDGPGKQVRRLLREAEKEGLLLGGVCVGQHVLAAHDALRGKKVAWTRYFPPAFFKDADGLTAARFGALDGPPDLQVGLDGNVLTARGPENAPEFARLLVLELQRRFP